jgi:hypothetical protein
LEGRALKNPTDEAGFLFEYSAKANHLCSAALLSMEAILRPGVSRELMMTIEGSNGGASPPGLPEPSQISLLQILRAQHDAKLAAGIEVKKKGFG